MMSQFGSAPKVEPLLGYFDEDKSAALKLDPTLDDNRRKYLDKVHSSGLSLLDQPLYPEFTKTDPYFAFNPFAKSLRSTRLAHVDDEVCDRYENQVFGSMGFDIVDFPGVARITPFVPMNLYTNPEAIARAKGVADLAVEWYNDKNNTGFEVVSVDKANCNPELSMFVDSEKYIIAYKPARDCPDHSDYSDTCFFCQYALTNDMFLITFTAEDKNKDAMKVFQAQVEHLRDVNEDVVNYCREKEVVG